MTYFDLLVFQQWCFAVSAAATALCIYSLLKWQAREQLARFKDWRRTAGYRRSVRDYNMRMRVQSEIRKDRVKGGAR